MNSVPLCHGVVDQAAKVIHSMKSGKKPDLFMGDKWFSQLKISVGGDGHRQASLLLQCMPLHDGPGGLLKKEALRATRSFASGR